MKDCVQVKNIVMLEGYVVSRPDFICLGAIEKLKERFDSFQLLTKQILRLCIGKMFVIATNTRYVCVKSILIIVIALLTPLLFTACKYGCTSYLTDECDTASASDPSYSIRNPIAKMHGDGNVNVVWNLSYEKEPPGSFSTTKDYITYSSYSPSVGWAKQSKIASYKNLDVTSPRFSVNSNGLGIAIWKAGSDAFSATYTSNIGWSSAKRLDGQFSSSYWPDFGSVTVSDSNRAFTAVHNRER